MIFSMIVFKILVTLQGTKTFSTWGKGNPRLNSALVVDMSVPARLVIAGRVLVRFSLPLMMFSFDEAGEVPSKLPTTKGVHLNPFSHDHGRGKWLPIWMKGTSYNVGGTHFSQNHDYERKGNSFCWKLLEDSNDEKVDMNSKGLWMKKTSREVLKHYASWNKSHVTSEVVTYTKLSPFFWIPP